MSHDSRLSRVERKRRQKAGIEEHVDSDHQAPEGELKKNSFLGAAGIATAGLVLVRVLSLIYIIPFNKMTLGNAGMNQVYLNANTAFTPFYELSLAGLPTAIAYLVSSYNGRGEYATSDRIFRYIQRMLFGIGVAITLVFIIFAPYYSKIQVLDMCKFATGAQLKTCAEMDLPTIYLWLKNAMYFIAPALIIIPVASGMRGYLQGYKTVTGASVSQVVEQLFRITVMLGVLYFGLHVWSMRAESVMAYAMLGIPISAFAGLVAVYPFYKKTRKDHQQQIDIHQSTSDEKTTDLIKMIIKIAFPFVLAGIATNLYTIITNSTFFKTAVSAGIDPNMASHYQNIIMETSNKLVSIPLTFSLALSAAIISFITSAFESGDTREVKKYTVRSYRMTSFFTLGMVLGMAALAMPLVIALFGNDEASLAIYPISRFDGFRGVLFAFLGITISILQSIGKRNQAVVFSFIGPLVKLALNVPFIHLWGPFGDIAATMIGLFVVVVLNTILIVKVTKIKPGMIIKTIFKTIIAGIPMVLAIYVVNLVLPMISATFFVGRVGAFVHLFIGFIIGAPVFLVVAEKIGLIREVFGADVNLRNFVNKAILRR